MLMIIANDKVYHVSQDKEQKHFKKFCADHNLPLDVCGNFKPDHFGLLEGANTLALDTETIKDANILPLEKGLHIFLHLGWLLPVVMNHKATYVFNDESSYYSTEVNFSWDRKDPKAHVILYHLYECA